MPGELTDHTAVELSFLVVDDDPSMCDLIERCLSEMGAMDIEQAATGEEALAVFEAAIRPPDVLLADLRMPGIGGVEMLRRAAQDGYDGAVILVSSVHEETLVVADGLAQYRDLNLVGRISKPFTVRALRLALGNILSEL
jgi:CheY-like chemotaxis protein